MGSVENTIFISYRRTDVAWAQLIHGDLRRRGYDVFLDFRSAGSGDFEDVIFAHIRARAYFLVLLTPSAFERCGDPADLFRREIETALDSQRHIVPIMLKGFAFDQIAIPHALAPLRRCNGLAVPEMYTEAALNCLCEQFLGGAPGAPSQAESLLTDLTGPLSEFYVDEPRVAPRSDHYYRFACAPHVPHDDSTVRRLTRGEDEKQFSHCIREVKGGIRGTSASRATKTQRYADYV
jgi:hypothetical protein